MLDSLLALAVLALGGRILLSILPPGIVGSHRTADLPATWAASHVLGTVALAGVERWCALAGVAVSWPMLGLALAVVLALRLATSPGAIVPGHRVPSARTGPVAWILRGVAGLVLAYLLYWTLPDWMAHRDDDSAGAWWGGANFHTSPIARVGFLAATCILIDFGLKLSRRAPLARVLIVLVWLAIAAFEPAIDGGAWVRAAMLAGAAAWWIGWRRRADRRSLALCAFAFAGVGSAQIECQVAAWCGLAVCVLCTPRAGRRRAQAWSALAGALLALPALIQIALPPHPTTPEWSEFLHNLGELSFAPLAGPLRASLWIGCFLALVLAGFGIAGGRYERRARGRADRIDPPIAELPALCIFLAVTSLLAVVALSASAPGLVWTAGRELFTMLAPVGALVAGLVIGRAERPVPAEAFA